MVAELSGALITGSMLHQPVHEGIGHDLALAALITGRSKAVSNLGQSGEYAHTLLQRDQRRQVRHTVCSRTEGNIPVPHCLFIAPNKGLRIAFVGSFSSRGAQFTASSKPGGLRVAADELVHLCTVFQGKKRRLLG